jgi:hypothetical protein
MMLSRGQLGGCWRYMVACVGGTVGGAEAMFLEQLGFSKDNRGGGS